jgi:uncharacterized coiled-coil protein SlyX
MDIFIKIMLITIICSMLVAQFYQGRTIDRLQHNLSSLSEVIDTQQKTIHLIVERLQGMKY